MKTITLFLVVLLSLGLKSQNNTNNKFHAGLKVGMNTSQMTGDGFSGFYKFSLVAGAFANSKLNDKWKFQYELVYQGKGSNDPARPDKAKYSSYKIKLNYIQIPLMFQFKLKKKFELEFGSAAGFLISYKEWDQNGLRSPTNTSNWRSFELDALLGLNYFVSEHFIINARTQHSVNSIVTNGRIATGTASGAWNIVIALTANYQF